MPSTFLGKWKLYVPKPDVRYFASDGYASHKPSDGPNPGQTLCVWFMQGQGGPFPPGNEINIAFILRADYQVCFLMNTGKYIGFMSDLLVFVNTLEDATGFTFPRQDYRNLPTRFDGQIGTIADGKLVGNFAGMLISGQDGQSGIKFTISQVTPTMAGLQASGKGEGLDFAWVDLTGATLQTVSLIKADFSHCNLTNAKFSKVNFTGADFTNANLTGATFSECTMDGALLTNCTLTNTNFTGSTLIGAQLDGATFTGTTLSNTKLAKAVFRQADLTSVVANPVPQFYNKPLAPPSPANPRTSLAGCRLKHALLGNDWSMLDLTDATIQDLSAPLSTADKKLQASYAILKGVNKNNLVGLTIQNAVFDYAMLDGLGLNTSGPQISDLSCASFIQASMHGTNLSGAVLKGANMKGAQLGALSVLFTLPAGNERLLNTGSGLVLSYEFAKHGITLPPTAKLNILSPNRVWELHDEVNNQTYMIRLESGTDNVQVLTAYTPVPAASLVNVYMPDANLGGANLYGVHASGAEFYGSKAFIDDSAILEKVEFNNANLSNLNLTQAHLYGANLSGATLFNAKFNKANLSPSADGIAANLSNANLQGADFTNAQLYGANLANAATAINVPTKAISTQGGVYLFSLPYKGDTTALATYTAELNGARRFTLPLASDTTTLAQYQAALKANTVAPLKSAFLLQQPPIILTASAKVSTIEVDSVWQIEDQPKTYTLWLSHDLKKLYVFTSLTNTRAGFKTANISLDRRATASIDNAGQQWLVDNDSQNPKNLSTGYVTFVVKLNGNVLDVFGSAVHIERLGDKQKLEIETVSCNVTTIGVTNMDGQTICPNGTRLAENQQSGKNWDELWLRALTPPRPPDCVPSDQFWCRAPTMKKRGDDNE